MVVAFHAGLPVSGGFVGVDVFFVISGFVITAMLQREWASTGRVRFAQFYLRRFKRLTPALAVMVTVTVAASGLVLSPLGELQQTAAKTAIGAMLLTANIVIAILTGGYFDAPAATNPLLNTWSLSVEEQFYLGFPAILSLSWLLARRTRLVRSIPIGLVLAVTIGSFGLAVIGSEVGTGPRSEWAIGFYGPFSRAWEFGVGALLALALARGAPSAPRLMPILTYTGAALLISSLWVIDGNTPFPGVWTLLPIAGTVLVVLGGSGARSDAIVRALSSRPAVQIGDWSYSIYLWHWPFVVFAATIWRDNPVAVLLAALVSFAPAIASYRWVEQPIRSIRVLSGARIAQLVSVTLVVPIACAAALLVLANHSWFSDTVRTRQDLTERAYPSGGCQSTPDAFLTPDSAKCAFSTGRSGAPVYLVGDSNAQQFASALDAATQATGRPFFLATTSGCPFTPLRVAFDPDWQRWNVDDQCKAYSDQTMQWLESQPAGTVFISNSDGFWRDDNTQVGSAVDALTADPASKVDFYRAGLIEEANRLKAAGHSVVFVQTIPVYDGEWNPRLCTALDVYRDKCTTMLPRADFEKNQGAIRAAVRSAADETGATVLDLADILCPKGVCSPTSTLYPYRDADHLSAVATSRLARPFETAIEEAAVRSTD